MRQKMQQQQEKPQQQQHQGQLSELQQQYPVISTDEFEQFMSSRQQQQQQYSTNHSIAKEYTVISPPASGFQFQSEKQQQYQTQGQSHHYMSNLTHTKQNAIVTLNALKAKNKNLFTIEDLGQEDHVPSKNNLQAKQQQQHHQAQMNQNVGVTKQYQSNQSNKQVSCYLNNRQTQNKTNSWNNNDNNNYSNKAQKVYSQSQVGSNKEIQNSKGLNQRQSQPKSQPIQNNLWYGQSDRDKENDDPQIISTQPRGQNTVVKSQSQYLNNKNTNSSHAVPEQYSFNPMLSKKSMKMAENMEDAYVRLSVSSLLKKEANIQAIRDSIEGQCKFKPTINSNYKMNKIEGQKDEMKKQGIREQINQENLKGNSFEDNEGVDEEDEMISSILTDSLEIDQNNSFDQQEYNNHLHNNNINTFQTAFFRDSQDNSDKQLVNDQQIKQISVYSQEDNNSSNRMQSENENINTQQQPQHRWERLYKQHEVILAKRAIEAARSKEAIDTAELTFKPNLRASKSISSQSQQIEEDNDNSNSNNKHQRSYPMDIAQRSEIWLNKKQAKINTAVAEAQVNALKHCTFMPVTISNSHKQQQNYVHQQLRTNNIRQTLGMIGEEVGLTDRDSQNGNEKQYDEKNNKQGEGELREQQQYQSKSHIISNGSLPLQSNNTDTNYKSTAQFSNNSPSSQLSSARDTLEYITDFNRRGLEQYFQRVEAAKNKRLLKQQLSQVSLTSGQASKRITVPKEFSFMKQNRQHSQDGQVSQRGNGQLSGNITAQIQHQQSKQYNRYSQQMMKIRSVSCNQLQTLQKQLQNLRM